MLISDGMLISDSFLLADGTLLPGGLTLGLPALLSGDNTSIMH
jgi:hypothetical protein